MSGGTLTLRKQDGSSFKKAVAVGGALTLTAGVKIYEKVIDGFGKYGDAKHSQPVRIFAGTPVFDGVKQEIDAFREANGEPSATNPLVINGLAVSFDLIKGKNGEPEKFDSGAEKHMIVVRGYANEVDLAPSHAEPPQKEEGTLSAAPVLET